MKINIKMKRQRASIWSAAQNPVANIEGNYSNQNNHNNDFFQNVPFETNEEINNLGELLDFLVKSVLQQQKKAPNLSEPEQKQQVLQILSNHEIEEQAKLGRVKFFGLFNPKLPALKTAQQNARQCFEDSFYKVFLNEKELTALSEPIILKENDTILLIRTAMLSGSWI